MLKRLHLTSLGVHTSYLLLRFVLRFRSTTGGTITRYVLFGGAALLVEYQLERLGRPRTDARGVVVREGEDLNQPGVVEYLFDLIYVTWGVLVLASLTEYAWWLYLVVRVSWKALM